MSNSKKSKKNRKDLFLKSSGKINLRVISDDPCAEIYLIDGKLNLVGRSIGEMADFEVHPGIYKAKIRAGNHSSEEIVEVTGHDKLVEKRFQPIQVSSAAPILDTALTHESHVANAIGQSRRGRVHVRAGHGSSIFVFSRLWTSSSRPEGKLNELTSNAARGIRLLDEGGSVVADVESRSSREKNTWDPWSACLIGVKPGNYRLQVESADGTQYQQSIVAVSDWQTQVFLLNRDQGTNDAPDWRVDLESASIMMSRNGFDASSDLRLDEIARYAIAKNRNVISGRMRANLLYGKFSNPFFGIYGAHLLLMNDQESKSASNKDLPEIISNLRKLLGREHPDVEALAMKVLGDSTFVWRFPPMLDASWRIVVAESASRPEIVPADSLAARVSTRLWGASPYLIWINRIAKEKRSPFRLSADYYKKTIVDLIAQSRSNLISGDQVGSDLVNWIGMTSDAIDKKLDARHDREVINGLVETLGIPFRKVEGLIRQLSKEDFESQLNKRRKTQ